MLVLKVPVGFPSDLQGDTARSLRSWFERMNGATRMDADSAREHSCISLVCCESNPNHHAVRRSERFGSRTGEREFR